MGNTPRPAYVSVYKDGSVLVACHGVELGQGLFTKVAQIASHTLASAIPPELLPSRNRLPGKGSEENEQAEFEEAEDEEAGTPVPMRLIRIADNDTHLLPNGGVTSGSTTSEESCWAVRLACEKIVDNLKPIVEKWKEEQEKKQQQPKEGEKGAVSEQRSTLTWPELCGRAYGPMGMFVGPQVGSSDKHIDTLLF